MLGLIEPVGEEDFDDDEYDVGYPVIGLLV